MLLMVVEVSFIVCWKFNELKFFKYFFGEDGFWDGIVEKKDMIEEVLDVVCF